MKITHEDYLKQTLYSAKLELKNLEINHRIAINVFNTTKTMLEEQIYSIESQLEG